MEDKLEENDYADEIYSIAKETNSTYGRLFLGGKEAANDLEFLNQNSIKAVLTLAYTADVSYDACEQINHKIIDADDTSTYQLCDHFIPCCEFIETYINECNVLVHCEKGISRSATIVIAFLMQREKKFLSEALEFVRNKRKEISPNGGFIFQLSKFQDTLQIASHRQHMLAVQQQQKQQQQNSYQTQTPYRFFRSRLATQPIENHNSNHQVNPVSSV